MQGVVTEKRHYDKNMVFTKKNTSEQKIKKVIDQAGLTFYFN
jgi:hypothetical protein